MGPASPPGTHETSLGVPGLDENFGATLTPRGVGSRQLPFGFAELQWECLVGDVAVGPFAWRLVGGREGPRRFLVGRWAGLVSSGRGTGGFWSWLLFGIQNLSLLLTTLSFSKSGALQDWWLDWSEILLLLFPLLGCSQVLHSRSMTLAYATQSFLETWRTTCSIFLVQPWQRSWLRTFAPKNSPAVRQPLGFRLSRCHTIATTSIRVATVNRGASSEESGQHPLVEALSVSTVHLVSQKVKQHLLLW